MTVTSFKDRYADAGYAVRLKAPMLRVMMFLFFAFLILTVPRNIMRGEYAQMFLSGFFGLVFVYLTLLLYRGRYEFVALFATYIVSLMLNLTVFMLNHTELAYYRFMGMMVMAMALALIFTPAMKHLLFQYAIATTGYLVYLVKTLALEQVTEQAVPFSDQIFLPTSMFLLLMAAFIVLRMIFDRVTRDAIEKMSESDRQTRYITQLLTDSATQLAEAHDMQSRTSETAASLVEIDKNIEGISREAGSLRQQYDVSSGSLHQINEKLVSLNSIAGKQAQNIEETGAALEQMVASIQSVSMVILSKRDRVAQLKERAAQGAKVLENTDQSFSQVSRQIESIKGMTDIISEISSQTNLLAMNAAIEAAHAGDRGRGFAVVAGEIRKLASSSSENAKQITDGLGQLIAAIEGMGGSVTDTGDAFEAISREVDEVNEAMDEINQSVQELNKGSGDILQATRMMDELTGEVTDAVQSVRKNEAQVSVNLDQMGQFVDTLTTGLTEISTGTGIITQTMHNLSSLANRLNDYTVVLNNRIKELS